MLLYIVYTVDIRGLVKRPDPGSFF